MEPRILEQSDPHVLGRRLREARRAAALTQQTVADQTDIACTTVVAIEEGERRATAPELIRLAKSYNRSLSDFVGLRAVTQGFVLQFRSAEGQAFEDNSEYEQMALDLQRRSEDYVELEHLAGTPLTRAYPAEYKPTGGSVDQIASDIATTERNRLGLGDGPIGNLRERLEAEVGLRIFYFAMPSKVAGVFAFNEDLGACVGINARQPRDRRQWSLAQSTGTF